VHLLPPGTLHVDVLNHWKSPVTSVNYPSGWHLEVHSQQLQAELSLTPELQGQELVVYQSTGNTYWEGAVSIQGQSVGQDVQGEGYVELTGYTPGSQSFQKRAGGSMSSHSARE
jgi:predicted secreted hydrolase